MKTHSLFAPDSPQTFLQRLALGHLSHNCASPSPCEVAESGWPKHGHKGGAGQAPARKCSAGAVLTGERHPPHGGPRDPREVAASQPTAIG